MRAPNFDFGTVVILSIIRRQGAVKPLRSLGSTGRRNNGASVSPVVKAQIIIDFVASKLSSWTISAGRGLPPFLPTAVRDRP